MDDGIHMRVESAYSYKDALGHKLQAEPGFTTDGASIPRGLWTLVGSPFTGKYRNAAVIHDVGCVSHKYSWQITHLMFYSAMIDSGVENGQALLFYFAVRLRGPRWERGSAEAKTIAELKREIGDTPIIGKIEEKPAPGISGGGKIYVAHFYREFPVGDIGQAQLESFRKEIQEREQSGHPITTDEIDQRSR